MHHVALTLCLSISVPSHSSLHQSHGLEKHHELKKKVSNMSSIVANPPLAPISVSVIEFTVSHGLHPLCAVGLERANVENLSRDRV